MITILSETTTNGSRSGVSYSYSGSQYSGISDYSMIPYEMKQRAAQIYLESNIDIIRKKYAKYSRNFPCKSEK